METRQKRGQEVKTIPPDLQRYAALLGSEVPDVG